MIYAAQSLYTSETAPFILSVPGFIPTHKIKTYTLPVPGYTSMSLKYGRDYLSLTFCKYPIKSNKHISLDFRFPSFTKQRLPQFCTRTWRRGRACPSQNLCTERRFPLAIPSARPRHPPCWTAPGRFCTTNTQKHEVLHSTPLAQIHTSNKQDSGWR